MEDFILFSFEDLQLDEASNPKHRQVDKNNVIAQIMLGDQCIENLVLGSLNATI